MDRIRDAWPDPECFKAIAEACVMVRAAGIEASISSYVWIRFFGPKHSKYRKYSIVMMESYPYELSSYSANRPCRKATMLLMRRCPNGDPMGLGSRISRSPKAAAKTMITWR